MKKITRIAKLELNTLFYSPIAWFLLIIFIFQCGLVYTHAIGNSLVSQQLGGFRLQYLKALTGQIFAGRSGVYSDVMGKIYLYLPLLTMSLMSREISSGTIKLLYSSPIKVREIIFGKFLAMVLYSFLLVMVVALFAITGYFNIENADPGFLFSGLLAIFLLLCTYSAIGLFMSCLTSYQVVAALSTLVVLAALNYVGSIWQDYDFFRDLTWYLSISGRAEHLTTGLLNTKDILYFLVIMYIFLGFSIYKLQAGRESTPAWIKAGRYIFIVVSGLTVGYIFSLPGLVGYYDATATKSRTLSVNAQKLIKEAGDEPIEVTSYINMLENHYWYGAPVVRNFDVERWEPYLRFKSNIHLKYVYYYDSTFEKWFWQDNKGLTLDAAAAKFAKNSGVDLKKFLTPPQIHQIIDLRSENNRYVMQLKYKDKSSFLRIFDDNTVFPSETEFSAALKRMMVPLPKIIFLTGELERSIEKTGDRDYKTITNQKTFRYSLVNQGFDVDTLSLKDHDLPTGIAALVIADPKMAFDPLVLTKIQKYIADGGNLLIAGEPGKQAVLNPLLQPLGVQLLDGTIVQKSGDNTPSLVLPYITATAADLSPTMAQIYADSGKISMPGVAALGFTPNGPFDVRPLLMTDGKLTWNKKASFVSDSAEVTYSATDGDEKGPLPTALRLTRQANGKEQRIIVLGDADFLSTGELRKMQYQQTNNFDFNTAVFGWFSYGEFPIDTSRPKSRDNRLHLTDGGLLALKVFFLGVLPGLLLIFGAVLLIRRKRK